jgi:hypothetical protein
VVAIEVAGYFALVGDPFFPWGVVLPRVAGDAREFATGFWIYPKAMLGLIPYGLGVFGFFYVVALLALVVVAIRGRAGSLALVGLWVVSLFLILNFGSTSLVEYRPLHKQFRFLSVLTLPLTVLVAAFLEDLRTNPIAPPRIARWFRGPVLATAVLVFLLLTSVPAAIALSRYRAQETAPIRWVAGLIAQRPDLPVYVPNDTWFHFLPFFLRHEGTLALPYYPRRGLRHYHRLCLLEAGTPLAEIAGYVVVDEGTDLGRHLMARVNFPFPHWTGVGTLGGLRLFLAEGRIPSAGGDGASVRGQRDLRPFRTDASVPPSPRVSGACSVRHAPR